MAEADFRLCPVRQAEDWGRRAVHVYEIKEDGEIGVGIWEANVAHPRASDHQTERKESPSWAQKLYMNPQIQGGWWCRLLDTLSLRTGPVLAPDGRVACEQEHMAGAHRGDECC